MGMHDIVGFIQIDELTASGGQPTREQFEALPSHGYEVVINLAPDGLAKSLPGEAELLAALGLAYHHIPVPWTAPSLDHLDTFTGLMDQLAGRPMLIHCQANMRVTAFYSLYAMDRLGWTDAAAQALRDRIWAARPGYVMDETWATFIALATQRIASRR